MRLLIDCTPLHSGGGVQVAIAFLENFLRTQNATPWLAVIPSLMAPALSESLRNDEHIKILQKDRRLDALRLRKQLRLLEDDFKPDCVFTIFGPSYFKPKAPHLMGIAIPRLVYPEIDSTSAGQRVKNKLLDTLRRRNLRRADHLIVETQVYKDLLANRLKINQNDISVIGNSLNPVLAKFQPLPAPKTNPINILVPSAFYAHKNLDVIPKVAYILKHRHPDFDFNFQLTLPENEHAWTSILGLAKAADVESRVTTLGKLQLPDLAQAYQSAALVFLPTLREVSTAVYPESFYFRRPLITSDLPFARELCADAAVYADPQDPNDMAKKLYAAAQSSKASIELTDLGRRQFEMGYPSYKEKFEQQLALIKSLQFHSN